MRDSCLYDNKNRRIGLAKGAEIYNNNNQRVATMRGNELFDSDDKIMMTIRGASIYDAKNEQVATLLDVQRSFQSPIKELESVALWYCFVR